MSVANQFNTLCNNLKVPQSTRSKISNRYQGITQRLNIDFWGIKNNKKHSLYVGSYARGTAVQGFSDLDIIFILPHDLYNKYNSYQSNGQSALLQSVKKSLQFTYPTTDIGGDGQVVVIQFKDGIKFEVVPAFEWTDSSFRYPDSNNGGSWKSTNPRPEIQTIKDKNKLMNGNLINLCRMARAWKKKWNVPMGGLLIDTLCNNFLKSGKYKDKSYSYYHLMSRDFFKYLSSQKQNQKYWYAVGSKQRIYRTGNFEYKAKKCYKIALEAIKNQSSKRNYSAQKKWKKIYGTSFPG
ncbi:nucleotidyltransferase [Moorena bouillonii PNG]|uniref:Nucleotidyltransferase n=2 Tax=Moorena TaxID=1155738 RepID=A0A1U7NAX6_9CYAN|nr:nucleotidyltransferase [Moorena bouillonii PNG]